jgi:hypothetical protein
MAKKRRNREDKGSAAKTSSEKRAAASPGAVAPLETGGLEGESAAVRRFLWISSLVLIVFGYFSLLRVEPGGQNAWSIVSPVCLLAGYLLVIPAIRYTYRARN